MGFGDDEDKLVIIADADAKRTNLVAYWRDEIPADFKQMPGMVSRRIAGQISIKISFLTIEPSPNVLGYEVAVLNTSYPEPVKGNPWGNALLSGVTRKPLACMIADLGPVLEGGQPQRLLPGTLAAKSPPCPARPLALITQALNVRS